MLSSAESPRFEDQDRRILEEDPDQGQPLPLAAGEVLASLGDGRVVAAGMAMISSWMQAIRAARRISSSVASSRP